MLSRLIVAPHKTRIEVPMWMILIASCIAGWAVKGCGFAIRALIVAFMVCVVPFGAFLLLLDIRRHSERSSTTAEAPAGVQKNSNGSPVPASIGISGARTFIVILGFAAMAAACAPASANLSGKWQLSMMLPPGTVTQTLMLKENNTGKLTGTVELQSGSRQVVGSVTADKIKFSVSTVTPNGTFNQNYTGTILGNSNSMKGTLSFLGHNADWTATR